MQLNRVSLPEKLKVNNRIFRMASMFSYELGRNIWNDVSNTANRFQVGVPNALSDFVTDPEASTTYFVKNRPTELPHRRRMVNTSFVTVERTNFVRQVVEHKISLDDIFLSLIWWYGAYENGSRRQKGEYFYEYLDFSSSETQSIQVVAGGISVLLTAYGRRNKRSGKSIASGHSKQESKTLSSRFAQADNVPVAPTKGFSANKAAELVAYENNIL